MAKASHSSNYNLLDSLSSSDSDLENVPRFEPAQVVQQTSPRDCDPKYSDKVGTMVTVIHVLVVQFTVYVLYLSFSDNVVLFTWHPVLMTVGWSCLLTEGILSFLGENCITKSLSQRNKVRLHWILQTSSAVLLYTGFLVVYINKNLNNKHHFSTWHAIFGLATLIFLGLTCLGGIPALFNMNLQEFVKPVLTKTAHAIFGASTFILGSFTTILAFYSHWFTKRVHDFGQTLCVLLVIVVAGWTLFKPIKCIMCRLKGICK